MQSLILAISIPPSSTITACTNPKAARGGKIAAGGGAGRWWTPLFGWLGEPDYFEEAAATAEAENRGEGEGQNRPMRKFRGLTEEKARELRMKTMEMEAFHDVMYHSAIASRLASDRNPRS